MFWSQSNRIIRDVSKNILKHLSKLPSSNQLRLLSTTKFNNSTIENDLNDIKQDDNLLRCRQLRLGHHVKLALANREPIVALESTVITHGMPKPENRLLAMELENIVSSQGSIPATIGIINGQLVIGLTHDEIEYLSNVSLSQPMKASRRDIPVALALKRSAGTTVACTMSIACSLAHTTSHKKSSNGGPIKIFATGGTGGVHKGGELSMDISADLFEFSRSPMGVVSSGFKSFLDTRRSLEYLETIGCTLMSLQQDTYNQQQQQQQQQKQQQHRGQLFPAFYSSENDEQIKSPLSVENVEQVAEILYECLENPLVDGRGALVAVPIPRQFSLDNLAEKLREASKLIDSRMDLQGFEKTPLILAKLNEITEGKSLVANLELLKNNARVGSQIARQYELIKQKQGDRRESTALDANNDDKHDNTNTNRPLVIGCTMVDMHVSTKIDENFRNNAHFSGITFEGKPHLSVGGVGRNLAVALEYLGCAPKFITAIANDTLGSFASENLKQAGLTEDNSKSLIKITPKIDPQLRIDAESSSCFALVLRDSLTGQCEYVIANLDTINTIGKDEILQKRQLIADAPLVILDSNLSEIALQTSLELCSQLSIPIFIEPTDCLAIPRLTKCLRDYHPTGTNVNHLATLACMSPNLIEFQMMAKELRAIKESFEMTSIDQIDMVGREIMQKYLNGLKCLIITMDKAGVFVVSQIPMDSDVKDLLKVDTKQQSTTGKLYSRHFRVPEPIKAAVSGSGAGDSFAAGFIASLLTKNDNATLQECIQFGFKSARLALMDQDTIPKSLKTLGMDLQ